MSHSFPYQWYPSHHGLLDDVSYPVYSSYPAGHTRSPLPHTSVATDKPETAWDSSGRVYFDSESPSVPLASDPGDHQQYCTPISAVTEPQPAHIPSTSTPSSPPTAVKIEPDDPDSRFIMDLAAYPPQSTTSSRSSPESYGFNEVSPSSVPPAEVPLRATQASKEMRRMMGVFRLNPFSMHNLSRGDGEDSALGSPTGSATWCGEAGPLDEEPVMFEFQLDIIAFDEGELRVLCSNIKSGVPGITPDEESQLRPFSPSFELQDGDISEGQENCLSDRDQGRERRHDNIVEGENDLDDNDRYGSSWEDGAQTESDGNTSASSSVSVQTPLNEISCSPFHNVTVQDSLSVEQDYPHNTSLTVDIPTSSAWNDVVVEPYNTSPSTISRALGGPKLNFVYPESPHRSQKFHLNNSHPYLRKNSQNYSTSPTKPSPSYPTYVHPMPQQPIPAQPDAFVLNMPQPTSYHLRRLSAAQAPTTPQDHISTAAPPNLPYPINQQPQQNHHHPQPEHHRHQQQPVYTGGHHAPISSTGGLPVATSICVRRSTVPAGFVGDGRTGAITRNGEVNLGSSYVTMQSSVDRRAHTYVNRFEELEGEQERYVRSPHSPTTGHAHTARTGEGLYRIYQHREQQQEYLGHHNHPHQQEGSPPSSPLGQGQGHGHGVVPAMTDVSMRTGHVVASSPVFGNQIIRRWSFPEVSDQPRF